jgi:hypothetical protein
MDEVVIPRGEEGVVVPRGYDAPMAFTYGESLSPCCEAGVGFVFHVSGEGACKYLDRGGVQGWPLYCRVRIRLGEGRPPFVGLCTRSPIWRGGMGLGCLGWQVGGRLWRALLELSQ